MAKLFVKIMLILLTVFLGSCSLKRSNPLDPNGNGDIIVPEPVTGITYTTSSQNQIPCWVKITWTANNENNTDGYYIYRGMGYYSSYALVGDVTTNEFMHSSADDPSVQPKIDFYYRISAYKICPEGKLEGRRSEPYWVRIP